MHAACKAFTDPENALWRRSFMKDRRICRLFSKMRLSSIWVSNSTCRCIIHTRRRFCEKNTIFRFDMHIAPMLNALSFRVQ